MLMPCSHSEVGPAYDQRHCGPCTCCHAPHRIRRTLPECILGDAPFSSQPLEQLAWLQPLPDPREAELRERAVRRHEVKTLQHSFSAPLDHLDAETRDVVLEGRLRVRGEGRDAGCGAGGQAAGEGGGAICGIARDAGCGAGGQAAVGGGGCRQGGRVGPQVWAGKVHWDSGKPMSQSSPELFGLAPHRRILSNATPHVFIFPPPHALPHPASPEAVLGLDERVGPPMALRCCRIPLLPAPSAHPPALPLPQALDDAAAAVQAGAGGKRSG